MPEDLRSFLEVDGYNVRQACLRCWYFNPVLPKEMSYRCHTSECPGHLPEQKRIEVIASWKHPREKWVGRDILGDAVSFLAKSFADEVDREILDKLWKM